MKIRDLITLRRRPNSESGQATTEFALILFPFLVLVGGIIYFGIGLNFWLDMNRVANQGARQAVVDNWPPYCLRTDSPAAIPAGSGCNTTTSATPCSTVLGPPGNPHTRARLQDVLRCSPRNNPTVRICYPGKTAATAAIGDPVRVMLTSPYTFWFVDRVGITLTATATMRLEQKPVLQTGGTGPTC